MVPRRCSQPRLEPLAIPLSTGGLPLRRPDRRERPSGPARTRVRAPRHRRVRRGPLLDRRGRLRQGQAGRPVDDGACHERRAGRRHHPRAADRVVPQHVELGRSMLPGRACGDGDDGAIAIDHPFLGDLELLAGAAPDGTAPTALFCHNETNDGRLFGVQRSHPYPKDGINDHVVSGAPTIDPERAGHQGSVLVPHVGRARRDDRAAAAPAAHRLQAGASREGARAQASPRSTTADAARRTSSTPSWARPTARRRQPWSCARHSPGCCGASSCTPTT